MYWIFFLLLVHLRSGSNNIAVNPHLFCKAQNPGGSQLGKAAIFIGFTTAVERMCSKLLI